MIEVADLFTPGKDAVCHLLGKLDAGIKHGCDVSLEEVRVDLEAALELLRAGWKAALELDLATYRRIGAEEPR